MQFLPAEDGEKLERKAWHRVGPASRPRVTLYYESGHSDYAPAAQLIAGAVGNFTDAMLLFKFAISGDGWNEHSLSNKSWQSYRKWRSNLQECRRLYERPCHQFTTGEQALFASCIEFALRLGWDAVVSARPRRNLLLLSHDDRLEIYAGFGARELGRRLIKLGYWRE